ncbi:PREDICTED: protein-cysteine N-palmitoyltransferase HHAT [Mesitornis unicolor]|uniref:protein-cysteine N-palmitoyltransferase HHAT n=1 Tax=Mesitornis unicolor TaxID=54374 RepID=UPI0005293ACB|nr:PREDICTED: protein-cysteine N-palmitoyltransferase HHAT [Mesitornis unicolor]
MLFLAANQPCVRKQLALCQLDGELFPEAFLPLVLGRSMAMVSCEGLLFAEYEAVMDRRFGLEPGTLFRGLKKDPMDFEWSYWIEWGRERILWLLAGHLLVSQVSRLLVEKYKPWCLMAYGMAACWLLLGIKGFAIILLHATISFAVAQFQLSLLTWLCSLILLSTLRIPAVEEAKRKWYNTENEYYLLLFTVSVRCLFCTSFSLEYCWQGPAQKSSHSFLWMLAYVFYYPTFHNGPLMNFDEFSKQMRKQEAFSLKTNLSILILGIIRIFFWWCLAELMIHLMYIHALYSSTPPLETVSYWALGGLALAQVLFFYVKYLVLYGVPSLLLQMDGLKPPALPCCVSLMHSFTKMWRNVLQTACPPPEKINPDIALALSLAAGESPDGEQRFQKLTRVSCRRQDLRGSGSAAPRCRQGAVLPQRCLRSALPAELRRRPLSTQCNTVTPFVPMGRET